jgi:putative sigma-54 modulation protein
VRTIVKGKNYDVPEADRRYAAQKMHRLERVLEDGADAVVELSVEHHKNLADSHIAEVTLVIEGGPIRGVGRAATHHEALDVVIDKLERRAVSRRKKQIDRHRPDSGKVALRSLVTPGEPSDPTQDGRRIVKVKRFAIEPMFEEDAVAEMEELGHNFFVFVNAENERLGVLYRRSDGNYGLIEPTIGGEYTVRGDEKRGGTRARRR